MERFKHCTTPEFRIVRIYSEGGVAPFQISTFTGTRTVLYDYGMELHKMSRAKAAKCLKLMKKGTLTLNDWYN